MSCPRCGAEMKGSPGPWCVDCERVYDTWIRQHAADIVWQTGIGAVVAMLIGLGLPLLGFEPVIATLGVLVGFATFMAARRSGKHRRRQQFLSAALPRAYLPSKT